MSVSNACLGVTGLVLVSACAAFLTSGGSGSSRLGGSGRICVPREWTGGQAMMTRVLQNGEQSVTQSMTIVYYSAIQQKIRTFSYDVTNQKSMLFDYPEGRLYIVTSQNGAHEVCTNTTLPGPFVEQCIPDNHTRVLSPGTRYGAGVYTTLGFEAQGELEADLHYHVTFSDDKLPMMENIYGVKNGVPFFQNVFFFNVTRTTFPPSSFSVPASCH